MSRYTDRDEFDNDFAFFRSQMDRNQRSFVRQYVTPTFDYPSDEMLLNIGKYTSHLWRVGDSFEKLASEHYGVPTLWWLIAFYNQKPTEHSIAIGERLVIPLDVNLARSVIGI